MNLTAGSTFIVADDHPLFREALAAEREVDGNNNVNTMLAAGNLGKVLLAQGKLAEAEPLLVEAVAWWRKTHGYGGIYNAFLVELRRVTNEILEEQATANADFARVLASQRAFAAEYQGWKGVGYLPRDF